MKGNFKFISSISLMAVSLQFLRVLLQLYPLYYSISIFLQIGTSSSASKHAFLLFILKSNWKTKFYNPKKASSSGPASLLKRVVPACGLPRSLSLLIPPLLQNCFCSSHRDLQFNKFVDSSILILLRLSSIPQVPS